MSTDTFITTEVELMAIIETAIDSAIENVLTVEGAEQLDPLFGEIRECIQKVINEHALRNAYKAPAIRPFTISWAAIDGILKN